MAENAIISDLEFAPQLTDDMVFAVEDTQNTYSATLGQLRGQLNKVFVEVKDVDFNLLVDDGFYQASGTLSHTPVVGSMVWLVQVVKEGSIIVQTAFSNDAENYLKIYRRRWNGTQWDEWKDVSGSGIDLTPYADKNLSNITTTAKDKIKHLVVPDYQAKVTYQENYYFAPPSDGVVFGYINTIDDGYIKYLKISNVIVAGSKTPQSGGADTVAMPFYAIVNKNDSVVLYSNSPHTQFKGKIEFAPFL